MIKYDTAPKYDKRETKVKHAIRLHPALAERHRLYTVLTVKEGN